MEVQSVWFEGDCIKCAMCIEEAPAVFDFVSGAGPQIKRGVDIASFIEGVKRAVYLCPTQYIKCNA